MNGSPFVVWGPPEAYGGSEIERLRDQVQELRARLDSLNEKPQVQGVLVGIHERDGQKFAHIWVAGQTIEKRLVDWNKGVKVGMTVRILGESGQPVGYLPPPPGGLVVTVDRIHEGGAIECTVSGVVRMVSTGIECAVGDRVCLDETGHVVVKNLGPATSSATAGGLVVTVDRIHEGVVEFSAQGVQRTAAAADIPCKVGDRVMVDGTGMRVVKNLGAGGKAKAYTGTTGVSWDDIGGLEDAKRQLREAIEDPVLNAETHARYEKRACKGICLFGPPGTGKTMLGRAAATALAKVHGKSATGGGFLYVKGPELLHGIVSSSESNVRELFASARAHHAEHGYPALIFLDEADGLLAARGRNPWEGMERTVVPMFLAEMDGLDATGATVILATNRPDAIDPAFLRDGRIDRKIEVPRPDEKACRDIFGKALRGRPFSPANLPTLAAAELFSDKHILRMVKTPDKGRERQTLASQVSGAMVAGVVERATQRAMRRAVAGRDEGITLADVQGAVADVLGEELALAEAPPAAASVLARP